MRQRTLEIVKRYGGPEKINRQADEARQLDHLVQRLQQQNSPYLADLKWLQEQVDQKRFVSLKDYRQRLLGPSAAVAKINKKNAVTMEVSALQYFPWVITEARRAIEKRELMPGRFIRVRNMAEQVEDQGGHSCRGSGHANLGCFLCGDPGHQRHRRFQHPL